MTKKQLTEFLRIKWQIKIVGPAIYQPTYEDIADALIKEGFCKVDEPRTFWVCPRCLDDFHKLHKDHVGAKIFKVREVEND